MEQTDKSNPKTRPWLITGGMIVALSLVWWLAGFEILWHLMLGWYGYLARVVPEMHLRWDAVLMMVFVLLTSAVLGHKVLSWLASEIREDAEKRWRKRSTAALVALVVVLFVAGTCIVGVAHQSYWLATSEEPLRGESLNGSPWTSSGDLNLRMQEMATSNYGHGGPGPEYRLFEDDWQPHSYVTHLLPYMSYSSQMVNLALPWDHPNNLRWFRSIFWDVNNPEFRTAPLRDRQGLALNHYAGNSLVLGRDERQRLQVKDGDSNTLLIGQVNSQFVAWGRPDNTRDPRNGINTPNGFGGAPTTRGAKFVMMDGSVRTINEKIDPAVLHALSTPDED